MAYGAQPQSQESSLELQTVSAVKELVDRFNRGDLDYLPNRDKEKIALLALQHGQDFKPESKPVRKALFDFADTALFGMIPNKWRPESLGEEYFGESKADKFAGGLGTIAGLGTGLGLGYKGVQALRGGAGSLGEKIGSGISSARSTVTPYVEGGISRSSDFLSRGAEAISPGLRRGGEYVSSAERSLWDMVTPAGNRMRSENIAEQIFGGTILR
jgi:hypothetical protein